MSGHFHRLVRRALVLCLLVGICSGVISARETETVVSTQLASVYRSPSESSEQVTQVLLGDPVQVLRVRGGWAEVMVPQQYRTERGYPGWTRVSNLRKVYRQERDSVTVAYPEIALRARPSTSAEVLASAFLASRLTLADVKPSSSDGETWLAVLLPGDDRVVWVRERQVRGEKSPLLQEGQAITQCASLFKGTPYLWGGMSEIGIDCSGLVYTVYRLHGITVPRDADQQFQVGQKVSREDLEPGDMVFFGKAPHDITHVGLYAGNGRFVHASSGVGVVESRLFQGWYLEHYQGARRILSQEPQSGVTLVPGAAEGSR